MVMGHSEAGCVCSAQIAFLITNFDFFSCNFSNVIIFKKTRERTFARFFRGKLAMMIVFRAL
jgi:hypothetical protein